MTAKTGASNGSAKAVSLSPPPEMGVVTMRQLHVTALINLKMS
jgi:hypothetical protein